MNQFEINIFQFIKSITKRIWTFGFCMIGIVCLTLIYAFTRPIKYTSTLIFYPLTEEAADPRSFDHIVRLYDATDQSDRFILFGNTRSVKDFIIKKFSLNKRYEIYYNENPSKIQKYLMYQRYNKNIELKKSKNGAVEITVKDSDPDTVALIANEIAYQIDRNFVNKVNERNQKIFNFDSSNFFRVQNYVNGLKDSLEKIKKSKNFNIFNEVGISNQIKFAMEKYTSAKLVYEQHKLLLQNDLKSIQILEPAQPALKKSEPKRLEILIFGTTIGFILLVVAFMIYDYYMSKKEYLLSRIK